MATQSAVNFENTGFSARLHAIWNGIVLGMTSYCERKSRFGEIQALEAKSDAELAAMGLRREDIARHVFRDLFYV